MSGDQNQSNRLGSLAKDTGPMAQLGNLRMSAPAVKEEQGEPSTSAAGGAGGGGRGGARKKRFAPTKPARRKVKDEDGGEGGVGPSGDGTGGGLEAEAFRELIKQAQTDASTRGRGRGRGGSRGALGQPAVPGHVWRAS